MSVHSIAYQDTLVSGVLPVEPRLTAGLRHAGAVVLDLLMLTVVVSCLPVVILAVGIPIALGVRLLLWIAQLL